MSKASEEFLRQYAKGKVIELFIRDGGGELGNNTRHIAEAMEAYKEHCAKAENLPISDVVGSFTMQDLMDHYIKTEGFDFTSKVIDVLNSMVK